MIRTFDVISVVGVGKPAENGRWNIGGFDYHRCRIDCGYSYCSCSFIISLILADKIISDIDRACTEVVEALEESANSHNTLPLGSGSENLREGEEENVPISVSEEESYS